jgi:hypothetical protein
MHKTRRQPANKRNNESRAKYFPFFDQAGNQIILSKPPMRVSREINSTIPNLPSKENEWWILYRYPNMYLSEKFGERLGLKNGRGFIGMEINGTKVIVYAINNVICNIDIGQGKRVRIVNGVETPPPTYVT